MLAPTTAVHSSRPARSCSTTSARTPAGRRARSRRWWRRRAEMRPRRRPSGPTARKLDERAKEARESAQKLLRIADEKDAFMMYGHDPDQWRRLHKAPGLLHVSEEGPGCVNRST